MEKTIVLNLRTARELYQQGGVSQTLALTHFTEEELNKKELSKTWKECAKKGFFVDGLSQIAEFQLTRGLKSEDKNLVRTEAQARGILALTQLLQCRDEYRNGWTRELADNGDEIHFAEIRTDEKLKYYQLFSFQSYEIAEKFSENFEDLLNDFDELIK